MMAGERPEAPRIVELVDKQFWSRDYAQPLDIDLLKVTLTDAYVGEGHAAVMLSHGEECTGRIGRIEVDTVIGDGVKINATTHDLTVESGFIRVWRSRHPLIHEDGIQVQGGARVLFRDLSIYAPAGDAVFINGLNIDKPPEDIVFENCTFRAGGALHVFIIKRSLRSGLRNCVVVADHPKSEQAINTSLLYAIAPVNASNRIIDANEAGWPR